MIQLDKRHAMWTCLGYLSFIMIMTGGLSGHILIFFLILFSRFSRRSVIMELPQTIFVGSLVVALLFYAFYSPIPSEIDEPWKLRLCLASAKMEQYVVRMIAWHCLSKLVIIAFSGEKRNGDFMGWSRKKCHWKKEQHPYVAMCAHCVASKYECVYFSQSWSIWHQNQGTFN